MKILSTLLALALFAACNTASAQWQWLDNEGRRVFSDRSPPPSVPEKNIIKRPGPAPKVDPAVAADPAPADGNASTPSQAASVARTAPLPGGVDKELEARKKQAAEAEAAKRRADEERITKARIESCARAKQAKATLDSGVRIAQTNASGEREVLDDAGRAAELKRIQAIIASDCR